MPNPKRRTTIGRNYLNHNITLTCTDRDKGSVQVTLTPVEIRLLLQDLPKSWLRREMRRRKQERKIRRA